MKINVGARLSSAVCSTEVIVVRSPSGDVDLGCGGVPMLGKGGRTESVGEPQPGYDQGSQLGKRYVDEGAGLELLVTRAGRGSLAVSGTLMQVNAPKQLPSSD
jgi:hypothetical protein